MAVHIHSLDVKRLEVDLTRAGPRVTAAVDRAITKTAFDIEADAKAVVPVDTGFLRGSISTDTGFLHAEIGPTANYAHYVEEGTSRQAPQPYMGPAFERRVPGLVDAIGDIGEGIL